MNVSRLLVITSMMLWFSVVPADVTTEIVAAQQAFYDALYGVDSRSERCRIIYHHSHASSGHVNIFKFIGRINLFHEARSENKPLSEGQDPTEQDWKVSWQHAESTLNALQEPYALYSDTCLRSTGPSIGPPPPDSSVEIISRKPGHVTTVQILENGNPIFTRWGLVQGIWKSIGVKKFLLHDGNIPLEVNQFFDYLITVENAITTLNSNCLGLADPLLDKEDAINIMEDLIGDQAYRIYEEKRQVLQADIDLMISAIETVVADQGGCSKFAAKGFAFAFMMDFTDKIIQGYVGVLRLLKQRERS